MATGRRPKPTVVKLITGNPSGRPLNFAEPQPRRRMPQPPDCLTEEARTEWHRVAKELHALGVLTALDAGVLAAYSTSFARWKTAERAIAAMATEDNAHGLLGTTTRGAPAQNPLVWTAAKAMADTVRYADALGLTPASRSRLTGTPSKQANVFEEFALPVDPVTKHP